MLTTARQHVRDASHHPALSGAFLTMQLLALNALGLLSTAYIIRRLGALQYGQWAVAAALSSTHLIVTNLGLRPLFVREVARRPQCAAELVAVQLALRLMLGGFACVSTMVICVLLQYPPVVIGCMTVGCVWIMISVVSSTLGDLLQSTERFGTYSVVLLISGLVVTACSVAVVYRGYGPIGLSVAYLTAPAVNALLFWWSLRKCVPVGMRWDTRRACTLLAEAREVGLNLIATTMRDRAEQLLVPKFVGLEAFGIFSGGTMVADRLANVPDVICTAFYPRISSVAGDTHGALDRTVTSMLTIVLATSVPFAIVGAYLAGSISDILLPGSSTTCRDVIQVTVWAVPVVAISLGMSFSLQAAGYHQVVARAGLRATILSAALSLLLIASFGLAGASWSFVARPAILVITLLASFRRTFPGLLPGLPFGRILMSASTLGAICLFTNRQRIWPALACAGLGVGTYGLALLVSRVLSVSVLLRHLVPASSK
jgi:O-antigen/teichoic acid export membrane protein